MNRFEFNIEILFSFPIFRYSEEVFSQHSRRHSNDTNSDLSDDEIFLPDEAKLSFGSGGVRRTSKTGEILASPTHRKLTPTHIKSTGSSPIKRAINRHSRNQFRSFDYGDDKMEPVDANEIHEHYRKVIAELKQMHEDNVKHMQYKLQSLEAPPPDDEYLVSTSILVNELVGGRKSNFSVTILTLTKRLAFGTILLSPLSFNIILFVFVNNFLFGLPRKFYEAKS